MSPSGSDEEPIRFQRPDVQASDEAAILRALRTGRIGGNGEIGRRVQSTLAARLGVRGALLAPNATQAIEIALAALGIGRGDEVVLPSFSFVSIANAVLARGATPVFCEIDDATLNLDVADAAARVTERTRAVLPTHYAGVACDLDALGALAESRGLAIVEDAAQALGSSWRGRALGSIGTAGAFSFHETKNVTCGEGGAFVTDDPELLARAEVVHEKGTRRSAFLRGELERYEWVEEGGNFVLSDLLAALLESQLEREPAMRARRTEVWSAYHAGLEALAARGVVRLPHVPEHAAHNAHLYVLRVPGDGEQARILDGLRASGIEASFHFQPLHASPFARERLGCDPDAFPRTLEAARSLVRLPLHAGMTPRDAERVVAALTRLFA